ncbi:MAG: GTP cyclohydrolase I [Candidatus Hodgkinia cicadicola]
MDLLVRDLIASIGEDSFRHGLELTPQRVSKLSREIYYGYAAPLSKIAKSFKAPKFGIDLVYVKNVFFCSSCEHHMMPFFGVASLVYAPSELVIGLSKIVSVLNCYSARLQSQERLTCQVLSCIKQFLRPKAIALKLECKHMCMIMRGVKSVCATAGSVACAGAFSLSKALFADAINSLTA